MSFKCQNCNEPQETGLRPIQRVVQTRPIRYGLGTEIVRVMKLCPPCDVKVLDAMKKIEERQIQLIASKEKSGLTVSLLEAMH